MRKIGIPEIEDIATGAALLGAGGGGALIGVTLVPLLSGLLG